MNRSRGPFDALTDFLQTDAAGGVAMVGALVAALVLSNVGAVADRWSNLLTHRIGPGSAHLDLTVQGWASTGLLTIFFFVVGLELKRELVHGELRDRRRAIVPAAGAIGGMVGAAAIYLVINAGGGAPRGWGVPMATEVAFALGLVALAGPRMPRPAKIALLTLAIVDDLLTIVVIAVGYGSTFTPVWLLLGAAAILAIFAMQRARVAIALVYVVPGVALWYALLRAGVEAPLAGALLGLLTPAHPFGGHAVLEQLEHRLHPWSAFLVIPLFALTAAGVRLSSALLRDALHSRIVWGIVAGRLVGKLVGVTVAMRLADRRGATATRAERATVAVLSGIGFTVALVVAELAFHGRDLELARLGILVALVLSAGLGAIALIVLDRTTTTAPEH